jgi:hypothetical protein
LADRTLVFATNGRHSLRGLTQVNPQEFSAVQDDEDDLTYIVDMTAYLDGATISSVTRTANGPIVTNQSNTTTTITTRLKWFGPVDFKATFSDGDTQQFRINILPREKSVYGQNAEQPIQMPLAYTSVSDPTRDDDSTDNHVPGTLWLNTVTLNEFRCISNAVGAARWRHVPRFWNSTGASATLTGTVAETVLNTLSLPGGVAGTNGQFEIRNAWEVNNDASAKTGSIRIGAQGAGTGGTAIRQNSLASIVSAFEAVIFKNENGQSAQRALNSVAGASPASWGGGGAASATATINTANAFDIVWTGTLADSADSLTLRAWSVVLTRPDIT